MSREEGRGRFPLFLSSFSGAMGVLRWMPKVLFFFRAHVFPQIGLFQAFWQPGAYAVRFIYSGAGKKQENHDDRYGKENAGKGFSG